MVSKQSKLDVVRLRELLKQLPPLDVDHNGPLQMFDLFPKLPLELQNKIWKNVIEEPRMIRLYDMSDHDSLRDPMISQLSLTCQCVACFRLRDFFSSRYCELLNSDQTANFYCRSTICTAHTSRLSPIQDRRALSVRVIL
jgi:hypothetical protein